MSIACRRIAIGERRATGSKRCCDTGELIKDIEASDPDGSDRYRPHQDVLIGLDRGERRVERRDQERADRNNQDL
ncbi:hypothetical protein D3C71_2140950 [compost metagenome]